MPQLTATFLLVSILFIPSKRSPGDFPGSAISHQTYGATPADRLTAPLPDYHTDCPAAPLPDYHTDCPAAPLPDGLTDCPANYHTDCPANRITNCLSDRLTNHLADCREAYLDRVLQSTDFDHYYLVVKIESAGTVRETVVLNNKLLKFLRSYDNARFQDIRVYAAFLKDKVRKGEPLQMSDKDLETLLAIPVTPDEEITQSAAKGKEYFLNRYFATTEKGDFASLRHRMSMQKNSAIIKQLFDWNYLIGITDNNVNILDKHFCE